MSIEPQAEVERVTIPARPPPSLTIDPEIHIATWCPDDKAELPPEQVHLCLAIPGLFFRLVLRFKSPDTLGFLIEELTEYRREVWPDCEAVGADVPKKCSCNRPSRQVDTVATTCAKCDGKL